MTKNMDRADDVKAWLNWVVLTSVPLRKLDINRLPVGITSGCLIDYGHKRFILSVEHAVKKHLPQEWVIELGYDDEKGTEIYKPNYFNYLAEVRLSDESIKHIDFCYAEVPKDIVAYYQHINITGKTLSKVPRHIFSTRLELTPTREQIYAFSGQIFPEKVENHTLCTEVHVYPGMKYIGDDGEFHLFKLPVEHPGNEFFQGCSGAPIVDMDKNVVALVCSGDVDRNIIYGISVARYKSLFDVNLKLKK